MNVFINRKPASIVNKQNKKKFSKILFIELLVVNKILVYKASASVVEKYKVNYDRDDCD